MVFGPFTEIGGIKKNKVWCGLAGNGPSQIRYIQYRGSVSGRVSRLSTLSKLQHFRFNANQLIGLSASAISFHTSFIDLGSNPIFSIQS